MVGLARKSDLFYYTSMVDLVGLNFRGILFFFNLIIATLSVYEGRYAGCNCSIALLLIVYIAGLLPRQRRSKGPSSICLSGFVRCQRRVNCQPMIADLNWLISPSEFMNWVAFPANVGLVSNPS